jgi:uncharacterized protein YuzB (UPF0349 family)
LILLSKKASIICIEEVRKLFKPIVEFCLSNLSSGSYEAMEILEKDEELDVMDYGCLGFCGQCGESLFALVNGEVVTGETSEQLVKNIYIYLEENPII